MCCRRSCFRGENLVWSSTNSVVLIKWALDIGMGHDRVLLEALISTTAGSFLGVEVLVGCRAC